MPEDPEIDTDRLREEIDEELEREGGRFLRRVAITTALIAALAAGAALEAGGTANEALVLKTEATRLQAQASDQWAFYQAKGIKLAIQRADAEAWRANGRTPPEKFEQEAQRYSSEQADLQRRATALEQRRDRDSEQADQLLERHHHFADAVALFQVAIALSAIAALTRVRPVWIGSLLVGLAGLVFMVRPWLG